MDEHRLPIVGAFVRGFGEVVSIETIEPPPPPAPKKEYGFLSTEARGELRLNGEVIARLCGFNDFYGLETSVKSATKEMRTYAADRKIGSESELEVVVVKSVVKSAAIPSMLAANRYDKAYCGFEGVCPSLDEDLVESVVWSSKTIK